MALTDVMVAVGDGEEAAEVSPEAAPEADSGQAPEASSEADNPAAPQSSEAGGEVSAASEEVPEAPTAPEERKQTTQ